MAVSAILLGLFAVIGTGMVSLTYENTAERIAANHRETLLKTLHELIPADQYDNDIFSDTIRISNPALLGSDNAVNVYRARKAGQPVAAIIESIAPDGYSGNIYLLIAIKYNGQIAGVRVVNHRETPGLGDAIDTSHSNWILSFTGKSLKNLKAKDWAVKRDGGKFDQFTGATITPRAVVKAVHNALIYFDQHRDELFAPATVKKESTS
ncbi:MAG TPA: electron transport complex subunit RsxG [Gammaproteobacteria bacterium]|nr:electron transport complex subunit RsxG [Gammaproteobacteria bacterium]